MVVNVQIEIVKTQIELAYRPRPAKTG